MINFHQVTCLLLFFSNRTTPCPCRFSQWSCGYSCLLHAFFTWECNVFQQPHSSFKGRDQIFSRTDKMHLSTMDLYTELSLWDLMAWNDSKCHGNTEVLTENCQGRETGSLHSPPCTPFYSLFQALWKRSCSLFLLDCSIFYPYTLSSEKLK